VSGTEDTKEAKKQKRLIRNRMSAQLHRERQKQHVDQLQAQLREKVSANVIMISLGISLMVSLIIDH
jgi:hypothetical protein